MVRSAAVPAKAAVRGEDTAGRIARLEVELRRERQINAALLDVGAALGTTLDLDQLLELILQRTQETLDADRAILYLLDESSGELVSRIETGGEARTFRLRVGEGIAGAVARTGRPLRIKDAYQDRRFSRSWDRLTGYRTRSILAAPMKNHLGRTIGVVQALNKRSVEEFGPEDETLLHALATQAAVSIDNSRLFLSVIQKNTQLLDIKEQLEHRVRDLRLLFELESSMGRAQSEDELARGLLVEAMHACDAHAGALLLAEEPTGQLALRFLRPSEGPELRHVPMKPGEGFIGWAMANGQVVLVDDAAADPRHSQRAMGRVGTQIRSALAIPLEGEGGAPLGAVALYDKVGGSAFSEEDLGLLRLIAANVSTALQLFRSRVAREREERLSTIGRLLSGVVHDLKSPMTVINGYVQMMVRAEGEAERREYAEAVRRQFEAMTAMQQEVLAFARGEKSVLVRRVYLTEFFAGLAEELRRELDGTGIALELDVGDKGTARFDERRVARAIHNLVRNAVEAMGDAGGTVRIGVARSAGKGKGDLLVTVADTGPGIPPEIRGRLFQSFVTAGKKGGTGLGLAIVKKTVDEHGGRIEVASGRAGTTFTLVLPQGEPTR